MLTLWNVWKKHKKKLLLFSLPFLVVMIKSIMKLILWTCRIQIDGLEQFRMLAKDHKCILMFWHNRTTIVPYIFSQHTPELLFTALTSKSDEGNLLTTLLHSFHNIKTIRCSRLKGYAALKASIDRINESGQIIVITADGSRGPKYDFKPGIPFIALKTEAHVIPIDWEANHYWELRTWDKMRIPKPFSTIHIFIGQSICFNQHPQPSLNEAKEILKNALQTSDFSSDCK